MNSRRLRGEGIRFPGQEISWAGVPPGTEVPCYGTDGGNLIFAPGGFSEPTGDVINHEVFDGEPINGVAFSGNLVAVSSRSRVGCLEINSDRTAVKRLLPCYEGGAHGVIATASNGFVAPLGHDGLLFAQRGGSGVTLHVGQVIGELVSFYKLIALAEVGGGDLLVAAARSAGLLAMRLEEGKVKPPIHGHRIEGIDLIDVSSLRDSTAPRAVVALDRDGSLIWTRDVFDAEPPTMIELRGVTGTPYGVFSARGHVFILTSSELISVPNLARDFLAGESLDRRPFEANAVDIEAVDVFMLGEDELFIIEEEGGTAYRVDDLVGAAANKSAVSSRLTIAWTASTSPLSLDSTIRRASWQTSSPTFGELQVA